MGRKSVPFVDESSLLRLRLYDVLEGEDIACPAMDDHDEEDDDDGATPSFQAGAPAGVTLEDLYRRNRNRARLIGLLHTHRAYHGAPIVVVMGDMDGQERDWDDDVGDTAWVVQPQDRNRLVPAVAPRLKH
jgi:hypothetical protein